jgi:predicted lipoprotein with Yx(FWY)xxD motif
MSPTIVRRGARRGLFLLAPLAGLGMVAAACGSTSGSVGYGGSASAPQNGGPYGAPAAATTSPANASAATVVATRSTKLGQILTDSQGRTLYLFEQDQGNSSTCAGSCISVWPAFTTTGSAQAGTGASASLIGTTQRADGQTEITYAGHPLYYYAGDNQPGDTNGQGLNQFGAGWDVVSPQGNKVESAG